MPSRSAGYCISATAEREGMELIAVVMKGETADKRNADAKALLNYGFSAYALVSAAPEKPLPTLPVTMGETDSVSLTLPPDALTAVVEKAQAAFLSSPAHRRNVLSTAYTKVGIGVAVAPAGYVYVTQIFCR